MFHTPQAYVCSVSMMVTSSLEGGGSALEEAVVGTSYRAAAVMSASRAAVKACSFSGRRAMTCEREPQRPSSWRLRGWPSYWRHAIVGWRRPSSLAASLSAIQRAGVVETCDPGER
jgi:hypothetical protein